MIRPQICCAVLALIAAACSSPPANSNASVPASTSEPTAVAAPTVTPVVTPTPRVTPPAPSRPTPTAAPTPSRLEPAPVSDNGLPWSSCGALQCATLSVPVDHDDPTGPALDLAIVRAPAWSTDDYRGSLIVNPGGPGASGVRFLRSFIASVPAELRSRFDIVSWDPRGVGDSEGLRCEPDLVDDLNEVANTLDGITDELDEYTDDTRELGEACAREAGELLAHLGTVATARDLDLIRAAVGDDQLSYLGYSYGTRLGAVYATFYPHTVRAMVLDGAFPPGLSSTELALKAADLDAVLLRINRTCELEPSCAVSDPGLIATFNELRGRLSVTPGADRLGLSDRSALIGATMWALYVPSTWQQYAQGLADARGGNPATLHRLAEAWFGDGVGGFADIFLGANIAIMCADGAYATTRADVDADAEATLRVSPLLGDLLFGNNCSSWPTEPQTLPPTNSEGAPTILVVGGAFDPATPLRWAERLAGELADSALLTYLGDGHTAVLEGNGCVDDAAIGYLLEPGRPQRDSTCHPDTGYLGLIVTETPEGLRIDQISADSPAASLITIGAVITAVDGDEVVGVDSMIVHAGQVIALTVDDIDGVERSFAVTAGRRAWTLPPD